MSTTAERLQGQCLAELGHTVEARRPWRSVERRRDEARDLVSRLLFAWLGSVDAVQWHSLPRSARRSRIAQAAAAGDAMDVDAACQLRDESGLHMLARWARVAHRLDRDYVELALAMVMVARAAGAGADVNIDELVRMTRRAIAEEIANG